MSLPLQNRVSPSSYRYSTQMQNSVCKKQTNLNKALLLLHFSYATLTQQEEVRRGGFGGLLHLWYKRHHHHGFTIHAAQVFYAFIPFVTLAQLLLHSGF